MFIAMHAWCSATTRPAAQRRPLPPLGQAAGGTALGLGSSTWSLRGAAPSHPV